MNITELEKKTKDELIELAKEMGVSNTTSFKKQDIIVRLLQANAEQQGYTFCSGILEIMSEGYGFLRQGTLLPTTQKWRAVL
jgi:transcription termination factor Rho